MLERSIHSDLELIGMVVMLQRSIRSVFEMDSNGCYNVASRASGKLLKWMLERRIHSVLELLEIDVMLLRSIQNIFKID